jgi:hypothetical protein
LRDWSGHVETTGQRCRNCSKLLVTCIGPGPFGDDASLSFCLNCDELTPESSWAAVDPGLRR